MAKCEICGKDKPVDRILSVTNFRQCGNEITNICTECYGEYASKFKADTCAADYFSLTRIFLKDHGVRIQNNGIMQCELCGVSTGVRIMQFPDNKGVAPMFMCQGCADRWRTVRDNLPRNVVVPDKVVLDALSKLRMG